MECCSSAGGGLRKQSKSAGRVLQATHTLPNDKECRAPVPDSNWASRVIPARHLLELKSVEGIQ